jgi:hypothetical protein
MLAPCEAYEPTLHAIRADGGPAASCLVQRVFPGTFDLLRIPVLVGRDFLDTDTPGAPPVAVVSAPLARLLWPGESPLGRMLEEEGGRRSQVVGVVADHRWEGTNKKIPHMPMVFLSGRQRFGPLQTLLVRSSMPGARLDAWVEREVARVDPRMALERIDPLSGRVERMLQPQRLAATLFTMVGAAALVLSLLGLYTLQRFLILQRSREAGLRMALGASAGTVRLAFLASLRGPMGLGLGAGLAATLAGWRLLGAHLAGLPSLDPLTLLLVMAGLGATGLFASLLPLRRLAHAEPADLLRDPGA